MTKLLKRLMNEFIHYQSHMIGQVESVTIKEARKCVGKDQEQTNTEMRRSRRVTEEAKF